MATPSSGSSDNQDRDTDIGGIKKLSQKLYGRAVPKETAERRHTLHESYRAVAAGWSVPTDRLSRLRVGSRVKIPSILYGLFLFSIIFFVFSFGLASYFFFTGGNVVSNDRIDILITAPVASPAGEEFAMSVEIVNRNSAPLLLSDFLVEWPDGTRAPIDRKTEQPRTLEELGTIEPGKSVKTTARGVLFGQENDIKDVLLVLQYHIEGSNAYLAKEVAYSVTLSSAPIVLSVKAPPEMVSGQELDIVADVISNATEELRNVMLKVEYPFGFEPLSADPAPTIDNRYWYIGDFAPGERKTITIHGKLVAQNDEGRAFRFQIGSQSTANEREFSTLFSEFAKEIIVKRPFIATSLYIRNSTQSPAVVGRGVQIPGYISFTNTLSGRILDIEVEAKFGGNAFDRKTAKAGQGAYRSIDNTLFWNKNTQPKLAQLDPGKLIDVTFDIDSIPLEANYGLANPVITVDVVVRATRLREADEAPEVISTTLSREIRIESDVALASKTMHTVGPFTNFGPFPPRPDQETSYTVTWSAYNSASDIGNTRVIGKLPVNVRFTGLVAPSSEKVTFNADTREVRWEAGDVPRGTGYADAAREVSFQVAVMPSVTQVGSSLLLVTDQRIIGVDRHTATQLQASARNVTIDVRGADPAADGKGQVVP